MDGTEGSYCQRFNLVLDHAVTCKRGYSVKVFEGTPVFISACACAVFVVPFFKVRATKRAYNLIVHLCSYLASSLFLINSLEKVPNVQQGVGDAAPSSVVSVAGP